MKRNILIVIAMCLSLSAFAQKQPKKMFWTFDPPYAGAQWQNGDLINLPDGDDSQGTEYFAEVSDGKTDFLGRGACRSDDGKWIAVYPSSAVRRWTGSEVHFLIPHEQISGRADAPMYSASQDNSMKFKPLTAYLKFTLAPGNPPVREIRFCANKYISGAYKANLDARKVSVVLDEGDRFRNIVFKAQDGGVIAPGDYTVAIFARVLPDGMSVEIESEDGVVVVKKISSEIKLTVGKTKDLGVIDNLSFDQQAYSFVGKGYKDAGVIFWVNPEDMSKAKVVSAAAQVTKWASGNALYGIHTFKENYDKVHSTVVSHPSYKADPESFQAVRYCENMRKTHGGNWHVPSAGEMKLLFNAYYGHPEASLPENGAVYKEAESKAAAASFDAQLEALGGEKMLSRSNKYWICGQNSSGNMQYVNMSEFHNGNDVQTTEKYVRCVRDIHDNIQSGSVEYPRTQVGKILKSELCAKIVDVVWDTTYRVAEGVDYYQLKVITESYDKIDLYLVRTDPSKGLDVRVSWSDRCTSSKWVRQTPADMASHMASPARPVYAIVNADFCENRLPIRPRGPMHCDGKVLVDTYSIDPRFSQQALSYVGVTFDGKMTIGPSAEYSAVKKSLKECTGGGVILIKGSEIQGGYVTSDSSRDPRTALGYTSDNLVWILAADGRHKGTEGLTYMELATIFQSLGCSDAVNLDGGGSTQMLVRNPQTGKVELSNWPSDPTAGFGGRERPRLNGWVVMKK